MILSFRWNVIKICPSWQNALKWFSGMVLQSGCSASLFFIRRFEFPAIFGLKPCHSLGYTHFFSIPIFVLLICLSTSVFYEWNTISVGIIYVILFYRFLFFLLPHVVSLCGCRNGIQWNVYCIIFLGKWINEQKYPCADAFSLLLARSLSPLLFSHWRAQFISFPLEIRFMASDFD